MNIKVSLNAFKAKMLALRAAKGINNLFEKEILASENFKMSVHIKNVLNPESPLFRSAKTFKANWEILLADLKECTLIEDDKKSENPVDLTIIINAKRGKLTVVADCLFAEEAEPSKNKKEQKVRPDSFRQLGKNLFRACKEMAGDVREYVKGKPLGEARDIDTEKSAKENFDEVIEPLFYQAASAKLDNLTKPSEE